MSALVPVTDGLARETFSADAASKGFGALVRSQVGCQIVIPGELLGTQVALEGRGPLGRAGGQLLLGRVRKVRVLRVVEYVYAVVLEEVDFQLVFRRAAEDLHVAPLNEAEEGSVVPVNVVLPLVGGAEALVIVVAVYPGAFEPIRAIVLLQSLYVIF